jgi:hypothetical protein
MGSSLFCIRRAPCQLIKLGYIEPRSSGVRSELSGLPLKLGGLPDIPDPSPSFSSARRHFVEERIFACPSLEV